MRIAVVTSAAGAPRLLASTALIGALADGLVGNGVRTRVVGLARGESAWRPEELGRAETAAPWLRPPKPRSFEKLTAARVGILDERAGEACDDGGDVYDWYQELLLQRELQDFAHGDNDLAVMVYPRSYPVLSLVARITRRCGWRLLIFSTETLSDAEMGVAARDAYAQRVSTDADGVLAVSQYLGDYWVSLGVPATRILVMPTPVNASRFSGFTEPVPGAEALYIGNVEHEQLDYLFDVADIVRRQVTGFQLTIYGDATGDRLEDWREEVRRRGLAHVVHVRDPVSTVAIPSLLQTADVLVVPPRDRGRCSTGGFPMKLSEYLASGRPVVATRMGDIPKYLVDGESALLADPDDYRSFASAVVGAVTERDLARRIGANGRRVAEEVLDSFAVARTVSAFIKATPSPEPRHAGACVRLRRIRRILVELARSVRAVAGDAWTHWAELARAESRELAHLVRYSHHGYTRVVALKIAVVRFLRLLRLKPPT
jgi:glycosyltransferase involved in cell wall biosynthesis